MAVDTIARGLASSAKTDIKDITKKLGAYPVVSKTVESTETLSPNTYYEFGTIESNVTFSFSEEISGITNEYCFEFTYTSGTIGFEPEVDWATSPTWENGKIYQVSIVNNIGLWVGV